MTVARLLNIRKYFLMLCQVLRKYMLSKALSILFVNRDISHKLKICFLIGCVPCNVHRSAILNSRISEAKSLIIYRELEVSALTRIHRAPTWCKPGLASEVPQKF